MGFDVVEGYLDTILEGGQSPKPNDVNIKDIENVEILQNENQGINLLWGWDKLWWKK